MGKGRHWLWYTAGSTRKLKRRVQKKRKAREQALNRRDWVHHRGCVTCHGYIPVSWDEFHTDDGDGEDEENS